MPTTSNFGWTTPADTDLVKDGAAAIRTLGNGIDTSFLDLKGGTTGQVLSKNSNTDLDYTWTTPNVGDITEVQAGTGISVASGTGPIPVVTNTMATAIDAKGDLVVGTGADTFSRLAVGGTNGHTLQVDSSTATGLKWAAASSGGLTLLSTTSLSGASTTVSSISGSYKNLILVLKNVSNDAGDSINFRLNGDTGSNYYWARIRQVGTTLTSEQSNGGTNFSFEYGQNSGATNLDQAVIRIYRYTDTDVVYIEANSYSGLTAGNRNFMMNRGIYNNSAAVDSVSIQGNSGNTTGTLYIYGES